MIRRSLKFHLSKFIALLSVANDDNPYIVNPNWITENISQKCYCSNSSFVCSVGGSYYSDDESIKSM